MPFTSQEWVDRFVADLATVIGAIGGAAATAGPGTEPPTGGWVVTLRGEQGSRGDLLVEFDRVATEALAKRVMGMEIEPTDEVVVDTLKELCAQAAGSMVLEPPLVGAKLAIVSVEPVADSASAAAVLAQISVVDISPLPLRLWGDIALAETALPDGASDSASADLPLARSSSAAAVRYVPPSTLPVQVTPKLDVILDIDLPLTVRFGHTELPLRLIAALGPGSVIDLGRSPDDPVDVLVSNQLVARGEVVIVGGNYGVRITDVISPQNGIRALEDKS
jgi:flagellar motor switch protein FliN